MAVIPTAGIEALWVMQEMPLPDRSTSSLLSVDPDPPRVSNTATNKNGKETQN